MTLAVSRMEDCESFSKSGLVSLAISSSFLMLLGLLLGRVRTQRGDDLEMAMGDSWMASIRLPGLGIAFSFLVVVLYMPLPMSGVLVLLGAIVVVVIVLKRGSATL